MKPNELLKRGAALIGWFVNPRGKSYYDPCQTDGIGDLFVTRNPADGTDFLVTPARIPEVIEPKGVLYSYDVPALAVPGYTPWINIEATDTFPIVFVKNQGVGNTTNLYLQVASNQNGTGQTPPAYNAAFALTPGSYNVLNSSISSWPAAFGGAGTRYQNPMSFRLGIFDATTNNCAVNFQIILKQHITAR